MEYDNSKKRKEQDEDAGMLKLAAFYLFMSALCAMMWAWARVKLSTVL